MNHPHCRDEMAQSNSSKQEDSFNYRPSTTIMRVLWSNRLGLSWVGLMDSVNFKEHPAYTCNVYALKLGVPATVVAAAFALTYPPPMNVYVAASVALLCVFVFAMQRWVLPRIRTLRSLDLLVVAYCTCILFTQLLSLVCYPEVEVAVGVGCMLVLSALLFYSTTLMTCYIVLTVSSWTTLKWMISGPISPQDALQLLLIAPLVTLIARITIVKTLSELHAARVRETNNVQELRSTLERLQEETRRLESAEAQLQRAQKNEGLGIMAAGVAHDFNNTLAAINAFAEVIELESSQPSVRAHASEICRAVKQASSICKHMLTYAGKSTSQMVPIDLVEFIQSLRPLMQATCGKQIPVSLRSEEPCNVVMFNSAQLQQVLLNLINNGADAIAGSGTIEVTIANVDATREFTKHWDYSLIVPGQQGTLIALTVRDSGSGMCEETIRQMFDPYFTTKGVGHGFGLSNVLGIARSHKASLTVSSEIGCGTAITIYLSPAQAPTPVSGGNTELIAEVQVRRNLRLLIVDDDALVRDSIAEVLAFQGWNVCKAESGQAAVDMVKQASDFAAMIIDFNMPHMDGRETLRAIRALGCSSPAILCSGHISAPMQLSVLDEFQAFLPKPYHRLELQATLQRLTGYFDIAAK